MFVQLSLWGEAILNSSSNQVLLATFFPITRAFLEKQSNDWRRYWGPHPFGNRHAATAINLNQFRQHALEHVKPHYTPEQVKHQIFTYKKDTRGGDNWTITELKGLPDIAISEITDNINFSLDEVALPHQNDFDNL